MIGGLVAEWYRPDGAEVGPGEPVCRLECDYVAFEIEADANGILRHRRPAGSIERKGAVLGFILQRGEPFPPEDGPESVADDLEARGAAPGPGGQVMDAPPTEGADDDVAGAMVGPAPEALEHVAEPDAEDAAEVDAAPADSSMEGLGLGVVVTFPRRPAEPAGDDAGEVETAELLPEPGGAIPGLPLWEEDEARHEADVAHATGGGAETSGAGRFREEERQRFARIAAEAEASAEVLSGHVCVNWTRAFEAVAALGDEWTPHGPRPLVEDLAVRAIARALKEAGIAPGPAGLVLVEQGAERTFAVEAPLDEQFRCVVEARTAGAGAFERSAWVVVSLIPLGVERIEPRLAGGKLAFGLGAGPGGAGTVTMRFDSRTLGEGDAGRVLARVRSLVENPYRLWG